jgi:hypothetical protein
MHLSDAELGAALEAAGGGAAGAAARLHAAACAECGQAVQDLWAIDRNVADVLCLLDHSHPPVQFSTIEARAAQPRMVSQETRRPDRGAALPGDGRARRRVGAPARAARSHAPGIRWGVILLVAASAAAVAAVPRSPVRRLVATWVGSHHQSGATVPAAPSAPGATAPETGAPRGIAIIARDRVVLTFRLHQAGGEIRVTTAPSPDPSGARVSVAASGDGATYTVSRDTITIDNGTGSSLDYDVGLPPPSQLPGVSIRVADRVVFARSGASIETTGTAQARASYVISLTPATANRP